MVAPAGTGSSTTTQVHADGALTSIDTCTTSPLLQRPATFCSSALIVFLISNPAYTGAVRRRAARVWTVTHGLPVPSCCTLTLALPAAGHAKRKPWPGSRQALPCGGTGFL